MVAEVVIGVDIATAGGALESAGTDPSDLSQRPTIPAREALAAQ